MKTSKISALLLTTAMTASVFGGLVLADESAATTTIEVSSVTANATFTLDATRAQIIRAMAGQYTAEEVEAKLDSLGIGDSYPVEVDGTATYSAADQTIVFAGTGVMDVDGVIVEQSMEKTVPCANATAVLTVDGVDYEAEYDNETGIISCTYEIPADAVESKVTLSSITAESTIKEQPATFTYDAESASASLTANGESTTVENIDIANISITNIDATATVNEGTVTITSIDMVDGVVVVNYMVESNLTPLEKLINDIYKAIMDRASTSADRDYWSEQLLENDLSADDMVDMYLASDEFTAKDLSDAEYIEALYETFFGREASEEEIAYWTEALAAGLTKDQVVDRFVLSPEWAARCEAAGVKSGAEKILDFVRRLYTCALARDAENDGVAYWSGEIVDNGMPASEAAVTFFFGSEFVAQDNSDEEFVTRLYGTFMGREAGAEEVSFWVDALADGATRSDVFNGFAYSDEFAAICDMYRVNP